LAICNGGELDGVCQPKRKVAFIKTHKTGSTTAAVRKCMNYTQTWEEWSPMEAMIRLGND